MNMAAVLLTLITLLSGVSASAKDIPILRMSCETCKNLEIPLGLTVSDQNPRVIQAVFFNDLDGKYNSFSTRQLQKMTLVFVYDKREAAFISLATNPTAGIATLKVKFLKNGLWMNYGETSFNLKFNVHLGQYQVLNPDDQDRPITQAYIIPNKWGSKLVGLKKIVMQ